jgi:hypothetical protein
MSTLFTSQGSPSQYNISGVYQATVVNIADPMQQSRIQVLIPNLPPFDATPTAWATPAQPQGAVGPPPAPPALGTLCWIIFSGGQADVPVWFPFDSYPNIVPGPVGPAGATGPAGTPGTPAAQPITSYPFSVTGPLQPMRGTVRLPIPINGTILSITMTVDTAPFGTPIIADVHKNGSSIFLPVNRPNIPSGYHNVEVVPDVTALTAGDYLTVDIVQVGSSVRGSDLCLAVAVVHTS